MAQWKVTLGRVDQRYASYVEHIVEADKIEEWGDFLQFTDSHDKLYASFRRDFVLSVERVGSDPSDDDPLLKIWNEFRDAFYKRAA